MWIPRWLLFLVMQGTVHICILADKIIYSPFITLIGKVTSNSFCKPLEELYKVASPSKTPCAKFKVGIQWFLSQETKGTLKGGIWGELIKAQDTKRQEKWTWNPLELATARSSWYPESGCIHSSRAGAKCPPHTHELWSSVEKRRHWQASREVTRGIKPWPHSPSALFSPASASIGQTQLETIKQGSLSMQLLYRSAPQCTEQGEEGRKLFWRGEWTTQRKWPTPVI